MKVKSKIGYICVLLSVLVLSCVGCGETTDTETSIPKANMKTRLNSEVSVYVDPETGVNYLIYDCYHGGGITLRVDSDGKPMVTEISSVSD